MRLYAALIFWAYERFYREFAWTYDTVAGLVSQGHWYQWILAARPFLQGRVLELGFGTGYMQTVLAATHPYPAAGLDASPYMAVLAARRARRASQPVRLVQGRAQTLPFASQSVQSVLSTFPSNYLHHPHTLAEIRRVLQPDGRLVIVDGAWFTHSGLYERLIAFLYRLALFTSASADSSSDSQQPARHPHQERLEQAGFTVAVHTCQVRASRVLVFVAHP